MYEKYVGNQQIFIAFFFTYEIVLQLQVLHSLWPLQEVRGHPTELVAVQAKVLKRERERKVVKKVVKSRVVVIG